MSPAFTIRILSWSEVLPLARPVREKVFVEEQRVPRELEWDEWDERCDHAIACAPDGRAIGTARLAPDGRLGRMAVLRECRGRGVGGALLEALLERARELSLSRVRCMRRRTPQGSTGASASASAEESSWRPGSRISR